MEYKGYIGVTAQPPLAEYVDNSSRETDAKGI